MHFPSECVDLIVASFIFHSHSIQKDNPVGRFTEVFLINALLRRMCGFGCSEFNISLSSNPKRVSCWAVYEFVCFFFCLFVGRFMGVFRINASLQRL